jgi:hypothetical protein
LIGPLEIALAGAALLIGATGTFSPCGLSVIDTIGPTGHLGGRRTTVAACATFLPGAVAGGLITFGSLALAGNLLYGAGGRAAYLVAAALAVLAAVLEARGTRIVPQIRRQLPEHWRRVMPMPVAAALYGVLLGIGFTTFVLSFGVWALAGVSLAIGDPELGLLLGACFGLGRAIPIVVLAPLAGSSAGICANELMCERPGVYLGLRRGDAAALVATALALILLPGSAGAQSGSIEHASDPAASADALLFQRLGGPAVMSRGGPEIPLPGKHPTIGGRFVATITGNSIQLFDRNSLAPVATVDAPGADAVAVSDAWLAYRVPMVAGGDGIFVRSIVNPGAPTPPFPLITVGGSSALSRPAVDGSLLLFGEATPGGSRIIETVLGTQQARVLVRSPRLLLFDPAISGDLFTYVRRDARRSRLMVRRLRRHGSGRVLFTLGADQGTMWSDALSPSAGYVTLIYPSAQGADARILVIPLGRSKRLRQRGPRGGGNHLF